LPSRAKSAPATPQRVASPQDDVRRYELVLQRLIEIKKIEEGSFLPFVSLTMPTPEYPDDPAKSLYDAQRFHQVMAAALEEVCFGRMKRLIIVMPPRHGKTEAASKRFIPFYCGHNPGKSVIFGTYNDKFSQDIGRAVRDVIQHPATQQVFPNLHLKGDSAASDRLETTDNGVVAFVGRGGTTTGRGADLFVIDDPMKDAAEADSPTIRDTAWKWFTQVAFTRLMSDSGAIVVIQTRWHPDDIVGRLTDPLNDYYDPLQAQEWKIIDFPALALDRDPLGRVKGEALWPSRFSAAHLLSMQRLDPRGFSALYQGRPNPDGGTYFEEKWLKTYQPNELPDNLRIYAASDHAVSMSKGSDATCLMVVGVDETDTIWILDDVIWRLMTADFAVDNMLHLMRKHKPLLWWAERSHISKSLGPFLRKRMMETKTYCTIMEVQPIGDKQTRAQSIQGRMSMGKVKWPSRAHWWPAARDQLLKFPHDQHDDLVDALAYIGLGLGSQVSASHFAPSLAYRPGTFGALKADRARQEREKSLSRGGSGW
jgi:predicted phage terminase large subunit-like protein